MAWTHNLPTEPGLYWIRRYRGSPEVAHVEAYAMLPDDFGLVVWQIGGDDWTRLRECAGWLWWPVALVPPVFEGSR